MVEKTVDLMVVMTVVPTVDVMVATLV